MRAYSSFIVVALLGLSCAPTAEEIRSTTYPRAFNYVALDEVRTVMSGLAKDVIALDDTLRKDPLGEEDSRRILELLASLQLGALRLGQGEGPSNRPHFSYDAQRLRRDLELALVAASKDPPNYFLAGQIAGSCLYCHGRADEGDAKPPLRAAQNP